MTQTKHQHHKKKKKATQEKAEKGQAMATITETVNPDGSRRVETETVDPETGARTIEVTEYPAPTSPRPVQVAPTNGTPLDKGENVIHEQHDHHKKKKKTNKKVNSLDNQNLPGGTPEGTFDVENPSDTEHFTLTLERKAKVIQGCLSWRVKDTEGRLLCDLKNGGQFVLSGTVGDELQIFIGADISCNKTPYCTLTVMRPGNHQVRLKQSGDWTLYVLVGVALVSVILLCMGLMLGFIPLLVCFVISSSCIYKFCKAGMKDVARCETNNPSLDDGSVILTYKRLC